VGVEVKENPLTFRAYLAVGAGVWLARVDGEYAGCIALRPLAGRPADCEIKRLYVRERFRSAGTAGELLAAAEAYAASAPYAWAYLDTNAAMTAAIRFYERRGYEPCERYNDNVHATHFFRRRLDG
jgi:GNAT superfamily N-acetyltransferase